MSYTYDDDDDDDVRCEIRGRKKGKQFQFPFRPLLDSRHVLILLFGTMIFFSYRKRQPHD